LSGVGTEQLLRVPKINAGTGKAQASAVIIYTDDWQLRRKINGKCFDTTTSSTGQKAGT